MTWLEAVILAVIEGLTEFLPVSSTGHMILASSFMGIATEPFTKAFTVVIQLGTILSVVVLYFKRFFRSVQFYIKLFLAFIPAAVAGILFGDYIDDLLENVTVVAVSLIVGGIVLLFIDRLFNRNPDRKKETPGIMNAIIIGIFQVIALIPGVSRSAATIIGGLTQGLTRKAAAEFSFFLAVPTMLGATVYKVYNFYNEGESFSSDQINLLIVGNVVGFLVAMAAIRLFINFVTSHGFKIFGVYRILLGITILALQALGLAQLTVV